MGYTAALTISKTTNSIFTLGGFNTWNFF